MWRRLVVYLVAMMGVAGVWGQLQNCCEQCKTGRVHISSVVTRINCNPPGQTISASWPTCHDACTGVVSSKLYDYCNSCDPNRYVNFNSCNLDINYCLYCPAGKVGTGAPDDQCQTCQPGYEIENYGCTKCVPGKYQNQVHQTACEDCQQNYYSDTSAATLCQMMGSCVAGMYMSRDGDTTRNRECAFCPAGKYSQFRNIDTECTSCEAGKYQDIPGMTSCKDHTQCRPGFKLVSIGTDTKNFVCEFCESPWTTLSGSQTTCSDCVAGKYKLGSNPGTCLDCTCASQGEVYINCPAGSNAKTCTICTGTQSGAYCLAGQEPSAVCDGTQTENTRCVACPAGKEKPVAGSRSCVDCPTGQYKPPPASTARCTACTNKPANAEYLSWTGGGLGGTNLAPTTSACPWQCNAGYARTPGGACARCADTIGKFSFAGATVCRDCTKAPANAYYVMPLNSGGFDGASDACPWACNAGYVRVGDACAQCAAGDFRAAETLTEGQAQTPCATCSACVAGETYETRACTTTRNRVCSACSATCDQEASEYISAGCTPTQDIQCTPCVTKCPAGTYMNPGKTRCDGTTVVDTVAGGCSACRVIGDCEPGRSYLSNECDGTDLAINTCVVCEGRTCPAGFYSGGCGGLQPTQCLPLTVCGAGRFLTQWSAINDGVCQTCRDCVGEGKYVVTPCTALQNAGCGGEPCDAAGRCASTNTTARFCSYMGGVLMPVCGVCPRGYDSDDRECIECPEGWTCSRRGEVACQGQCAAGQRSACDGQLGYARCEQGQCNLTHWTGALVVRGTYEDPVAGDCATYFRCPVGWYKRFQTNGVVECAPCQGKQALARYVSGGLSTDDEGSCLWECDGTRQVVAWQSGGAGVCVFVRALEAAARHSSGWYGVAGVPDLRFPLATCPELHTTEANTALRVGECLACPEIPVNGRRVVGSRDCEWQCEAGFVQRGGRCVRVLGVGWPCTGRGTTRVEGSGECVTSAVPWNRPGTRKLWPPVRVAVERAGTPQAAAGAGTRVVVVSSAGRTIRAGSSVGGVSGRHWVEADGKRVTVQGPVCSMAWLEVDGHSYVACAVCNESFVAYVSLSAATPPGLHVLIGRPGAPGWADGFKTQARFGVELHVASEAYGMGSVWVLDRWNCVVREVVVWPGGPGDYRTRVFTVYGRTDGFLMVPSSPRCYGAGSLVGPRGFWDAGGSGFLFFLDDTGLWQLETEGVGLVRVLDRTWDVGGTRGRLVPDEVVSVWLAEFSVAVPTMAMGGYAPRRCSTRKDCRYRACVELGDAFCAWYGDIPHCYANNQMCPASDCPVGSLPRSSSVRLLGCDRCPTGKYVATANATSCTDQNNYRLELRFRDGTVWELEASTTPCGDDFTSRTGGDCAVGCVWRADGLGSYVDPATGACVPCAEARGRVVCGVGEELAECTRTGPARCEPCPNRSSTGKVYAVAGRCDEDEMRYLAPCPVGFYADGDGRFCLACPDPLSTTVFAGATRVEQCKCRRGLRRDAGGGGCVGRDLYAYERGACIREGEPCRVPLNATLVDPVRCGWECGAGLFLRTSAGWLDKCERCERAPSDGGVALTRGDDDAPLSCEYLWSA